MQSSSVAKPTSAQMNIERRKAELRVYICCPLNRRKRFYCRKSNWQWLWSEGLFIVSSLLWLPMITSPRKVIDIGRQSVQMHRLGYTRSGWFFGTDQVPEWADQAQIRSVLVSKEWMDPWNACVTSLTTTPIDMHLRPRDAWHTRLLNPDTHYIISLP